MYSVENFYSTDVTFSLGYKKGLLLVCLMFTINGSRKLENYTLDQM